MSLRDDVRILRDAADGLVIGWLPGWRYTWSTKEGEKLGWLILILWRKYYESTTARSHLQAKVASLTSDVDGLRTTNEILTTQTETLERHKEEFLQALGVERRINSQLTLQLQALGVTPKPYG